MLSEQFDQAAKPKIVGELQHGDIVLPVFNRESIIPREVMNSSTFILPPHTTFVRELNVGIYGQRKETSLNEFLGAADSVFSKVAQLCGALVVKHSWGLVARPSHPRYNLSFLPPNMDLAAEVPYLSNCKEPGGAIKNTLQATLSTYRENNPDNWEMRDAYTKQFVTQGADLILVDIDPLLICHNPK